VQNLKNVTITELDSSNGVLFICYDPDTQMVYLCGKVVELFSLYQQSSTYCGGTEAVALLKIHAV